MTLAEAKDYINKNLRDRTKASDPMYPAAIVRAVLFVVLDAAQGLISELKEKFVGKAITCTSLNALALNYELVFAPVGSAPARYVRLAKLLISSGGLHDVLRMQVVLGAQTGSSRGMLDLTLANRDGFSAYYNQLGETAGMGVLAYRQADGSVDLFLKSPNDFRCAAITVSHNVQAQLYESFTEQLPSGTLIYDTTSSANPPLQKVSSGLTELPGYLRTGSSVQGFQLMGFRGSSNQSLNVNGYFEVRVNDGNLIKLAVLN